MKAKLLKNLRRQGRDKVTIKLKKIHFNLRTMIAKTNKYGEEIPVYTFDMVNNENSN